MQSLSRHLRDFILAVIAALVIHSPLAAQTPEPARQTISVQGVEREYFVRAPSTIDPARTYWLIVAAHGAGGNGRTFFLARGLRQYADEAGLDAIVVAPTFSATDGAAQQFPMLGEAAFLDTIVRELRGKYRLHPRILLTGYSRGGQFSHRYCFMNPSVVEACAPFAAGSWTTPDGRLLIQPQGEFANLEALKSAPESDETRELLTNARIAKVAWTRAAAGAQRIPFHVMTGTLDPRLQVGQGFAASLQKAGFTVTTAWPRTAHTATDETREEFERYAREAIRFFVSVVARK